MRWRSTWFLAGLLCCSVLAASENEDRWAPIRKAIELRFPEVVHMSTSQLAKLMQNKTPPILLDVRSREEFEISHLHHAHLAPTGEEALLRLREAKKQSWIVVYCSVGYRSAAMADELSRKGYGNVWNLDGSIFRWANEGRPVFRGDQKTEEVHPYDSTWGRLLNRELWSTNVTAAAAEPATSAGK